MASADIALVRGLNFLERCQKRLRLINSNSDKAQLVHGKAEVSEMLARSYVTKPYEKCLLLID